MGAAPVRVPGVASSADTSVGSWRVRRQSGTRRGSETSRCHSARSYTSSRWERRRSNIFPRSQGRRRQGLRKASDAGGGDVSPQPRAGGERGSTQGPACPSIAL